MKFSQNTVLISGGSAGIGFEIARLFSDNNNQVIITGRDHERLRNAASRLKNVTAISSDISDPDDVNALLTYFGPAEQQSYVKSYPGVDTNIPIYILGSSTDSAYLAASLGLPYVFASHFAPRFMEEAISIYRSRFQPSEYLDKPYMMVCLNVIAAETDDEAQFLSTTMQQFFLNVVRGTQNPLQPPVESLDEIWTPMEKEMAATKQSVTLIGSKETVRQQWIAFQEKYHVDELMAVSYIYDTEKQKRSYEILKEAVDGR